jgi:homoserine kinase type II
MAVYTEVSDEALRAFLAEYDIGELVAYRGIAEGVENSNYSLRTTGGDFILTLYERRVNPADLPWFLGLMAHLADHGVVCPQPVEGRDGDALRPLCGKLAAITTFLPGVWPRRIDVGHCAPLGAALASLHLAGANYAPERPNSLAPIAFQPILDACLPRADELERGLGAALQGSLDEILKDWPTDLPRGQIHADLFPDNVFFLNGRISGLIDFYFACTDYLAYDLVVCLNAWCFEQDGSFNVTKARAMLGAYRALRPLTQGELAALPVLARGAAMRFLLTRLYDWLNTPAGAMVTPKNPLEYWKKLRFHQAAETVAAYGI